MFTAGGSCPGRGPQNHAPSWVLRVLWFPPPVGARSGGRPLFFPSRSAPCGRLGAVFFVLFWALRPSLLGRFPAALPPPLAPASFSWGPVSGPSAGASGPWDPHSFSWAPSGPLARPWGFFLSRCLLGSLLFLLFLLFSFGPPRRFFLQPFSSRSIPLFVARCFFGGLLAA